MAITVMANPKHNRRDEAFAPVITELTSPMNHSIARLPALFSIALLVFPVYIAAKWGIADLYYQPEVIKFKKLRDGKTTLSEKDWRNARANLDKALGLDPNNPHIHEYLASAIETPVRQATTAHRALLQQAIAHYRHSIALRPAWPYAWLGLAAAKYKSGQLDGEYYAALERATQLGPWEQVVQYYAIDLGLRGWPDFPRENRLFTLNIIADAVQHTDNSHVKQILQMIHAHGLLKAVCVLHYDKDIVNQYCRAQPQT